MSQYTPKPHTVAALVIDFLQINGGTLTPSKIADLFDTPRSAVSNALKPAVLAGLLAHHVGGRGKTGYHLQGTEPSFDDAQATPAPAPKKRKAKKAVATTSTRKPRNPVEPIEAEPSIAATPIA